MSDELVRHVAILPGGHPSARSGLQVVAFTHAVALQRRGWQVSFFAPGENDETSTFHGMSVHTFRRHPMSGPLGLVRQVRHARNVWKKHYATPPDVLHGHDYVGFFAVSGLSEVAKARKIFTVHDPFEQHQRMLGNLKPGAGVRALVIGYMERKVYRRSDAIHAISKYTRSRMDRAFQQNVEIVPNWVDTNRFSLPIDRKSLRAGLGVAEDQLVIFTARGLEPRMGLDRLIKAMPQVMQSVPSCRLFIAGDGPLRDTLRTLANGLAPASVTLLGFIPTSELVSWYQAADLLIMPSLEGEGFGLPILEAMACGTPVLGTPVCAIPEILGELPGRVFSGTTPSSIADGIIHFISDWLPGVSPVEERSFVLKRYSEEAIVGRILEDYL